MNGSVNVCLYNVDPEASAELAAAISNLNFVRLVADVDSPEQLASALQSQSINLIFFHLDPEPDNVVDVIEQISGRYPDIALVALSHATEPAAILAPMRAGCDQFVCEPIDPADLAAAVARVTTKRLLAQPKTRCICVVGSSGGVGTTSIACNLAMEIGHFTDHTCALVDMDLQFGDVSLNFDCHPKYTMYDLACAGADLDEAIMESTMVDLPCNVAMLARPEMLEHVESITPDTIDRVFQSLRGKYENIVVDVSNHLTPCSVAAMTQADTVLIVTQLLVTSVHNAKREYDVLTRLGIPEDRLQVVLNRFDGRAGRISAEDVEDMLHKPLFARVPNDYQFVARSIDFGQPVAAHDRKSPVRAAIRGLAERMTGDAKEQDDTSDARRGFFGRLLSR